MRRFSVRTFAAAGHPYSDRVDTTSALGFDRRSGRVLSSCARGISSDTRKGGLPDLFEAVPSPNRRRPINDSSLNPDLSAATLSTSMILHYLKLTIGSLKESGRAFVATVLCVVVLGSAALAECR